MKQGFALAFAQNLSLTPSLQQAIKLLQLPTSELLDELHAQVHDNPFLTLNAPLHQARIAANGSVVTLQSVATVADPESPESAHSKAQDDPFAQAADPFDSQARDGGRDGRDGRDRHDNGDPQGDALSWVHTQPMSLREHLHAQARCMSPSRTDAVTRGVLGLLIDLLLPTAYFEDTLEALPASLAACCGVPDDTVLHRAINAALPLLHSLDPPGVGAFDVRHCLLLQLRHPSPPDCVLDSKVSTHTLAINIIDHGFAALTKRDRAALHKQMQGLNGACDDAALARALALIKQLDPKPGLQFAPEAVEYALPEIIAVCVPVQEGQGLNEGQKVGHMQWQARLNPAVVPPLRVATTHAQFIKRKNATPQVAALHAQMQQAKQLVRTVQQHFDTLFRVGQAIVDAQQAFFQHGATHLKPMVLRDIADVLGLHESTVSRITTKKYLQSPHGVFELKYFFSSKLVQDNGDSTSSTAIKAHLSTLLQGEPTHKPLSDQALTDALNAAGHQLARRTVAKYREQLGYGPAHARKPF